MDAEEQKKSVPPAEYYTRLLSEMDAIGWNRLLHIDKSLTSIQLSTSDSKNRTHVVQLDLPKDYPAYPPKVHVTCSHIITCQNDTCQGDIRLAQRIFAEMDAQHERNEGRTEAGRRGVRPPPGIMGYFGRPIRKRLGAGAAAENLFFASL